MAAPLNRTISLARVAAILFVLAYIVWRFGTDRSDPMHEFVGVTMGTTFRVTVDADDASAEALVHLEGLIEERLEQVNGLMSTYDLESELSRLNQSTRREPLQVSNELFEVLTLAQDVSERSGGAFDVTVAPLVNAWGFGPGELLITAPEETVLAVLRDHIGYELIALEEESHSVSTLDQETVLDLSGVAKGYAVERLGGDLVALGYTSFLIEVGGELKARGIRQDGRPWRVGIESPDEMAPTIYGTVELRNEAIATSGDYRNFFEEGGVRYAHIIDPRTGSPLPFRGVSVSVVNQNAALADAWATALSVLGPTEGYQLADREGIAAIFITQSESGFESLTTEATADRFVVLSEESPS